LPLPSRLWARGSFKVTVEVPAGTLTFTMHPYSTVAPDPDLSENRTGLHFEGTGLELMNARVRGEDSRLGPPETTTLPPQKVAVPPRAEEIVADRMGSRAPLWVLAEVAIDILSGLKAGDSRFGA